MPEYYVKFWTPEGELKRLGSGASRLEAEEWAKKNPQLMRGDYSIEESATPLQTGVIAGAKEPVAIRYPPEEDKEKAFYKGLDITPPTAEEEATIRENIRKQMQTQIDAINTLYADLVSKEEVTGVERLGRTRAIGAKGGLLGSPMGETQMEKTKEFTAKNVALIEKERQLKISAVLDTIDTRAETEIRLQKAEALGAQERYFTYLRSVKTEAREDMKTLSQSGTSLDVLKANKDLYSQLLKETGYAPFQFDIIYNKNLQKENQISYKFEFIKGPEGRKNSIVAYGINPLTGQLVSKKYDVDFDMPAEEEWYLTIEENTGTPLIYNRNTGEVKIPEGYKTGQFPPKPKEPKTFLSSTDLQNLVVKGVPIPASDAISKAISEGIDLESIRLTLADIYGKDIGYGYLDTFMSWLTVKVKKGETLGLPVTFNSTTGQLEIIPQ